MRTRIQSSTGFTHRKADTSGYDLASRLTSLGHDVSGSPKDLARSFTYTPAGQLATRANATAAHAFSPAPGASAYAANGRNQYTSVAGATHTHDANGNLTSDGSRSFGYDAENRLTGVSGSMSLALAYDPLGRLRQTTAGTTTTDFLHEGDRLVAEYQGSTLLRRYAHGPGVDEPVVWYEGANLATPRWLHPDERGSIVAWTDAGGAATVYRYGAFGEPAGGDFGGARFRYTGQIALPEAALYHYKARVYDPTLGRFLQTDPVGYEDDFNLYAYVYNDPLNKTDASGTDAIVLKHADGTREIILPLTFSGDAATPENVSAAVDDIQTTFSGTFDGIAVNTTVISGTSDLDPAVQNEMKLTNNNTSRVDPTGGTQGHSYVSAGTKAEVTMKDINATPIPQPGGGATSGSKGQHTFAHEAGHLMNLTDAATGIMGPGPSNAVSGDNIRRIETEQTDKQTAINTVIDCSVAKCK